MGYKGNHRDDLLFPELSYKVMGILFEVSNTLGAGYLEKYYQKAIAALLKANSIEFKEQVLVEVIIGGEVIAKGYADFIIEDKIILEIKRGESFKKQSIDQLHSYLKMKKMKLGLLVNFTTKGLSSTRVVNLKNS